MDKLLKILKISTLVVWLLIGVLLISSLVLVKVRGQGFVCQLFRRYCVRVQQEQSPGDVEWQKLGTRLTPEVRQCIVNKLGREKVKEIVRQVREGTRPNREDLRQIQECIKEVR